MEKQQLISFVKKSHKKYPNNLKPRDIYREIQSDQLIRPAFGKIITGNDILMYCYMIPKYKEGVDLDKLYDLLKYYLTAFKVIYFEKKHPRKECPNCYGNGIEDCIVCGGDGKNDDATNCDDCEGEGTFECHVCRGSGEYNAYDEVKIEILKYVTYNPKIVDRLKNMEEGEVIEPIYLFNNSNVIDGSFNPGSNNIINVGDVLELSITNYETILIYREEDYGDISDYKNIEEDNYIFDSEVRNPKFQIGSLGRVSISM